MTKKPLNHRVVRFAIVGISNAALHFSVLNFSFYLLGQSKIVSSIIATVCAITFSFFLNRHFVFGDHEGKTFKQAMLFVIVTISGMLVVLNLVYALTLVLISGHEHIIISAFKGVSGIEFSSDFIDINVSTIIGAIFAMFWNYNGYRLFVFKSPKEIDE